MTYSPLSKFGFLRKQKSPRPGLGRRLLLPWYHLNSRETPAHLESVTWMRRACLLRFSACLLGSYLPSALPKARTIRLLSGGHVQKYSSSSSHFPYGIHYIIRISCGFVKAAPQFSIHKAEIALSPSHFARGCAILDSGFNGESRGAFVRCGVRRFFV